MSIDKRVFDFTVAAFILILSSPIILVIACAIKLDSPGPVFFCQKRHGKDESVIRVFKFRTMFMSMSDVAGLAQTTRNDPRITSVGRFLRRHSLDEVPQFINVLLGSMSLVGPRPLPIGMTVEGLPLDHVENWRVRYAMQPGLTGLAQINGSRGALTTLDEVRERLAFDLRYIQQRSLTLDIIIILRTIYVCVYDKQAC